MKKNFQARILAAEKKSVTLKVELGKAIRNLPDNPDIQRMGPQCFTLNFSQLSLDTKISYEYYDFKWQYDKIANIIKTKEINVTRFLQEIINTGKVKIDRNCVASGGRGEH